MAAITGILVQVETGDVDKAGTDGRVYLGLGGREFRLDSGADDYERGSLREYVLGRGPKWPDLPGPQVAVVSPEFNDPRVGLAIDTVNLMKSPVYLRFEPDGDSPNWNLTAVFALIYTGESRFYAWFTTPDGVVNLWMGDPMGKIVYLTDFVRPKRPMLVLPDSLRSYVLARED